MSELAVNFLSLPSEYQNILSLAQHKYNLTIAPLEKLVGGWSGATVYLVSVATSTPRRVEHLILKLDHQSASSKSDEVTRHNIALENSPGAFAREHIAELAFERLEHEGAVAIFYRIAGQSLRDYRPLSGYRQPSQLKQIFATTNTVLLTEWNANATFQQAIHPQKLLEKWLGFRLAPGGNIERFIESVCRVNADIAGFLINGKAFSNPLAYARRPELWGTARPIDFMTGFIHGDLNTNNILVKFSPDHAVLAGYYLIDFALFKEQLPLLYDQRYLEMSYLLLAMAHVSFEKCVELITQLAEADVPNHLESPIEMAGIGEAIGHTRNTFDAWIQENHPSLRDDLWGQYWLAGVAGGLSYCYKPGLPNEQRLAGLIYAAANLKRYDAMFSLSTPGELQQLYDKSKYGVVLQQQSIPVLLSEVPNNLPAQTTTFIGREKELEATQELLLRKEVRLVTLTGAGGSGKTRLSLEVVAGLLEHFRDGVFFIPLGDISDPAQVIARIAAQLEVREAGSQPLFENLKDYLHDKQILLLLDNFEHLTSAAPMAAELIAAAPALKILTTSRVRLNLRGENEWPILPLDIPDLSDQVSLERLAENESVQLFVERARAAQAGFTLTDANASVVAQICQRLDGLPLAIELAAARTKILSPEAILARLSDSLKLLTGGALDLPARQRTLRSTLDWSYGLLQPPEKTLYSRLAVFVAGFTLESVEAVCNPENNLDILEGLTSLMNNSLLRHEQLPGGELRFRMCGETIREYALEQLQASGELSQIRQRHAQFFADLVINEARYGLFGPNAMYWLKRIDLEHDNIQAALAWSQATPQRRELGMHLVSAMSWFWYRRGFFNEGRMWTERVLASSVEMDPRLRALALHMSARMAMWQGDLNTAAERARESLKLWQRLEDEQHLPWSQMENAVVLLNMGRDQEAHALLKEANTLFRENGLTSLHATTLVHLGNVALGLGNAVEARSWLEKALTVAREIGDLWIISFALNNFGEVARTQGEYDQARQYYEQSKALLVEMGDKGDLARLVHSLGHIAVHEGNFEKAEAKFRESLSMFRKLGNKRGIAECLAGIAGLLGRQGRPDRGATLLGAAEALLGAGGATWWPADRVELERNRAVLQAALESQTYSTAWTAGQKMTMEEAIALGTDLSA